MIFSLIGLINMSAITFNKELYSIHSIYAATEAFRHLADFKVSEDQTYIIVAVLHCQYNDDITSSEFGNYVIDSMNTADGNN